MRRQRRQLGTEIRRVVGGPRVGARVGLTRAVPSTVIVGVDQEEVVRLELGLDGIERLVEGGLGPRPVDRHLVRRLVARPVADGMRRAVVLSVPS